MGRMSVTVPPALTSVLLLDADLRTSQRLAQLLEEDGFPVEVLGDGKSAIARLELPPSPGFLITELSLPSIDGVTVARFAAGKSPSLRVIVLTRHPNLFDPMSFGAAVPSVLTKPLDYGLLMRLLTEPRPPTHGCVGSPSRRR